MKIPRTIAVAAVGVTAVSGALVLSHAAADTSTPVRPAHTTTTQPSLDAIVASAANEAGLAEMCVAGQRDTTGLARYNTTAAAHPVVAQQIGTDCTPVIGTTRTIDPLHPGGL